MREVSGEKKGLAEEGEKKGEGGCVEQGHVETLPLERKQEFRMVSDPFQHAANVWRKILFIHYCCSGAVVPRKYWVLQGPRRCSTDGQGKHQFRKQHSNLRRNFELFNFEIEYPSLDSKQFAFKIF